MATTKTLTPTNQAITLAAFTEKPDNRTNVTNDDRLADAVNTLNSNLSVETIPMSSITVNVGSAEGSMAGYKSLMLYNMRLVVRNVTISNGDTLAQLADTKLYPKTNIYLKTYNYTNGKLINGSIYLNTSGALIYYGDQLSNMNIMIHDCFMIKG